MNKKSPSRIFATLGLTCALFTATYAGNGNATPQNAPKKRGAHTYNGTSDSGGGTGLKGKVFESYAVDITTLPAFQKYVLPMLLNIKYPTSNDSGSADFLAMGIRKTWYFADMEFAPVEKKSLGVSFLKSSTDQIARQTRKEIWININLFGDPNTTNDEILRAQAETIVHESVMATYLVKYLPISSFCEQNENIDNNTGENWCESDWLNEQWAPMPERPLQDADNEAIRQATVWLLANLRSPVDHRKVNLMFGSLGFDPRFFGAKALRYQDANSQANLKISHSRYAAILNAGKITNDELSVCVRMSNGKELPCTLDFNTKIQPATSLTQPSNALTVKSPGNPTLQLAWNLGEEVELFQLMNGSAEYQSVALANFEINRATRVGDKQYIVWQSFVRSPKTGNNLVLDAIVLKPITVTSIESVNGQAKCTFLAPKPKSFADDTIIIRRENSRLSSSQKRLAEQMVEGICMNGFG